MKRFIPLLLLGACGPLVQIGGNSQPPASLLTLAADPAPGAGPAGDPATAVTVDTPAVPGTLQTLRVPVRIADTQVQYLTGAQWAEQPNRLFARLLADRLTGAGIAVIDARQGGVAGRRLLSGQLLEFGLDVRDPAAPVARVRFDAAISGAAPRLRRFEASEPVAVQDGPSVAAALNRAANRVGGEVSAWVGR